jgi:hypothetical protein
MLKIIIGTNPTFKVIPKNLVEKILHKLNTEIPSDLSLGVSIKAFSFKDNFKTGNKTIPVEVSVRWEFGSFNDTMAWKFR